MVAKMTGRDLMAIILLCVVLVGMMVLAWAGTVTKSELLPIVGGCVVVAHRLLSRKDEGGTSAGGGAIGGMVAFVGVDQLVGMLM
jgi:hypothetical protein